MHILVYGAGVIGQFIGARLADGGARVHLVGRATLVEAVNANGLGVSELDGSEHFVNGSLSASERVPTDVAFDLVLLTVKGTGTQVAALDLAAHLAPGTPVISFQNGVENVDRIRAAAPLLNALAGMVPYNVVQVAPGRIKRTTDGVLRTERVPITEKLADVCKTASLGLELRNDMREVQWGKLLLNLNNPINALSGQPLRAQLLDRGYRRLLASLQDEGLAALAAADLRPAQVTPLSPAWIPFLLRLPTPVFRLIAAPMLKIAADARSSMYDDRVAGRTTEVDDLCGAVVRLAERNSGTAPLNRALRELVSNAPSGRWYGAEEIRAAIGA
jgi:2-dehydropantoate 2-reductase